MSGITFDPKTIESFTKSLKNIVPDNKAADNSGDQFGGMLNDALGEVNNLQQQADESIKNMVTGDGKNIHETMISLEKADISFKLMMKVRTKLMDAYNEVIKMQV